jgi:hypothetical protein
MLKHQLRLGVSFALLLTLTAGPSVAQQTPPAPAVQKPSTECGGQYECVEDRPLTPTEAQTSRNHPQNEQATVPPQDPREVATTRPAVTR